MSISRFSLLPLSLLTLLLTLCQSAWASGQDPATAWQKIHRGDLVIDVRTPAEFASGHLPDAVNIPYQYIIQAFKQGMISKDRPVVLYCRSGQRSGMAQQSLIKAGYTQTYNAGGYQPLIHWQQSH